MKVSFTETALAEIEEIFAYIATHNVTAAAAVVDRVQRVIARLEDFPLTGHSTDEPGVRIVPVVRYPYLIFYAVADEEVVVLHVRHGARKRPWEEER